MILRKIFYKISEKRRPIVISLDDYTDNNYESNVLEVKDGSEVLTLGVDYTVTYSDNNAAGTATATVTFIGNYTGTLSQTFNIGQLDVASFSEEQVEVVNKKYAASKEGTKAEVVVKDGNATLVEGVDYDLVFENNTEKGTATVRVVFKGNYSGTIERQYTIVPADDAFHYISIVCLLAVIAAAVLYILKKIKELIPSIVSGIGFLVGLIFIIVSHECVLCVVMNILLMIASLALACFVYHKQIYDLILKLIEWFKKEIKAVKEALKEPIEEKPVSKKKASPKKAEVKPEPVEVKPEPVIEKPVEVKPEPVVEKPQPVKKVKQVHVSEVHELVSDDELDKATTIGGRISDRSHRVMVNVDTISEHFKTGETVTLEELKKRVPGFDKKATYYKVCARGFLDKELTVDADEFSVEAAKMVVATGGKVIVPKE